MPFGREILLRSVKYVCGVCFAFSSLIYDILIHIYIDFYKKTMYSEYMFEMEVIVYA